MPTSLVQEVQKKRPQEGPWDWVAVIKNRPSNENGKRQSQLWRCEAKYDSWPKSTHPPQAQNMTLRSGRTKKKDFPGGPVNKSLPASAGDTGSIPGPGSSLEH